MARLVAVFAFVLVAAFAHASGDRARRQSVIDDPDCGQRSYVSGNGAGELVDPRIVGGQEAVPNSWPFICSLRTKASSTHHMCGANLVKNRNGVYYLITAAHCTSNRQANAYEARCGIHGTNSNYVTLTFKRLTVHPNYNSWTLDNDIAIFELNSQPATGTRVRAVCIPNETWWEDELGIAVGWGTTSSGGSIPSALRQVTKPIKARSTCEDRYGASSITSQMLCAGLPQGGIDSCQGDSGGPFYTLRGGKWYLTGVVSWGFGCAEASRPGVYVDVFAPNIRNFIDGAMN